jgi:hypothetical protein
MNDVSNFNKDSGYIGSNSSDDENVLSFDNQIKGNTQNIFNFQRFICKIFLNKNLKI